MLRRIILIAVPLVLILLVASLALQAASDSPQVSVEVFLPEQDTN